MSNAEYKRWASASVREALEVFRVVFVSGVRQCGKTTLTRQLALPDSELRSLDNSAMKKVAAEDPAGFVKRKRHGPLVIDEIQKVPSLLPEIKLVVDENTAKGQYLVTGSANIKTLPSVTESLAGRMGTVRLRPLAHGEVAGNAPMFVKRALNGDFPGVVKGFSKADIVRLAFRGGYGEPLNLSFRAKRLWFKSYLDAMLLHDIRELMDVRAYQTLRRMAEDLFARSAKFFDAKEFTSAYGIKQDTFTRYMSILKTLFLVDEVEAWHETDYDGLGKRSKYFAADTGMMTSVLNWNEDEVNFDSDRAGKLVETWVYNQLAPQVDLEADLSITQFRDKQKHEIDFMLTGAGYPTLGIEVKAGSDVGKSDFKNLAWFKDNVAKEKAFMGIVLYAGDTTLPFGKNLYAVPLGAICG
ncbi:MAG: ATP-binding protein [Kiritimatiellae bacterium]|nr:ATP-binding protein [Kiritimatiellia bacterium]